MHPSADQDEVFQQLIAEQMEEYTQILASPDAAAEFIKREHRYRTLQAGAAGDNNSAHGTAKSEPLYWTMHLAGFDHTEPYMRHCLSRLYEPRIRSLREKLHIDVEVRADPENALHSMRSARLISRK